MKRKEKALIKLVEYKQEQRYDKAKMILLEEIIGLLLSDRQDNALFLAGYLDRFMDEDEAKRIIESYQELEQFKLITEYINACVEEFANKNIKDLDEIVKMLSLKGEKDEEV